MYLKHMNISLKRIFAINTESQLHIVDARTECRRLIVSHDKWEFITTQLPLTMHIQSY